MALRLLDKVRPDHLRDVTYSVADELLKWTALRDNGTMSEDEYEAARRRSLAA